MAKGKHENFMMVEDWVREEVGLISANVYGVILRHEEMRQGKCFASIETMSKKTSLARSTFCKHLAKLKQEGFIKDLTPDRVKAVHEYITVKEGPWKRNKNGVNLRGSVDTDAANLVHLMDSSSPSNGLIYTERRTHLVREMDARKQEGYNQETNEDTNPGSQKNANTGRSRAANYTNGDPVLAYRNMTKERLTNEAASLISESVTDVREWEALLRRAKMGKWDLTDVPELLTQYTSCGAATGVSNG